MSPHLSLSRSSVVQGRFQNGRPLHAGTGIFQARLAGGAFPLPSTFSLASGPGQPLPPAVQRKMEEIFATRFDDVRVHVGPQAASIGALAFTTGSSLYFSPGQYDPHSAHGQRLLGHELTHVVQQRAGRVRNPFGGGLAVVQDPGLEAEAERMGLRTAAGMGAATPGPVGAASSSALQCRGYNNLDITNFLAQNVQGGGESRHAYVSRITTLFKQTHQYQQRSDLDFLRDRAWGARNHLAPYPAIVVQLDGTFNAHVQGNQAGVGWHTEMAHQNGQPGYSYANRQNLATTKGTYFADTVVIAGTNKAGNNGRSTFFPAAMSMADIRHDALYVANTYPQVGQIRRGRAPRSGIMIDCLIGGGGTVVSAYPYKPGW